MKSRNTRRGFTLIELLVVVLIIGILAAVAVPQYRKAVYRSKYATLKSLVASIIEAEELYYLANGSYTVEFEDLDIDLPGGKNENNSTVSKYQYDWGYCNIQNDTFTQISCQNSNIGMAYQQRPSHSVIDPNARICVITGTTDTTEWRNQICQIETGNPTGTAYSQFNTISYFYK